MSIILPSACPNVGEMLSSQHSQQKKENQECLFKPLRGCGDDADSNFMQLMKMRARDDQHLAEWLEKKTNKYVSHGIQNEFLKVMALSVLRDISCAVHESSFYSIMCDECTKASNKEQLHGRSHRSGWSGFNRTTFRRETNEYSITTTHLIAYFARTKSICYLGVADSC